jgi:hypothetical protein
VTFISIHSVIIYVIFFGTCMRCTRICPLKSGVIQGKKRKGATSAISTTSKVKKVKVLTQRPRHVEMAIVPKVTEGPSSAPGSDYPALAEAKGESAEVQKSKVIAEQQKSKTTEVSRRPVEAREKTTEEPELRKSTERPIALSPSQESELPKVSKVPAITPKRRRMASVLDIIMESSKVQTPASAPDRKGEIPKKSSEAGMTLDTAKAGPSAPVETYASGSIPLTLEKESAPKKVKSPAPEMLAEELEFIVRHASGKQLSKEQIAEAKQYARDLKYPERSLVYNGTDEDFLYCLLDDKDIPVCREMVDSIGYPKLELGLSVILKDQLTDGFTFNSLKVRMLLAYK